MKKADFILIASAIILAGIMLAFFFNKKGSVATVYCQGEIYKTVDLKTSENMTFTVNNVEIQIENGKIRANNSTCHDKVCVKQGFIEKAGQTVACVPNGVVIVISGSFHVDGVTG